MTSLMVFLTCWVLAQLNAYEVFPVLFQGSQELHLPNAGIEYRRMALDVCVVLFFAILFYYALMLPVVHTCTGKLLAWAELEPQASKQAMAGTSSASSAFGKTIRKQTQKAAFAGLPRIHLGLSAKGTEEAKENYNKLRQYFFDKVPQEPALLKALADVDTEFSQTTFPFWIYIRLAVRNQTDRLFQFGLPVWACLIVTFVGLLFLHRFAHWGCVRIMGAVVLFIIALLMLMVWWIHTICSNVMKQPEPGVQRQVSTSLNEFSVHRQFSTEEGVIICLHVLLFFVCYLAARFICMPWMWRLHFWLVLGLTCVVVLLGTAFVLFIAPLIPDFCVALAMPPYVDPTDVATMMEAIEAAASKKSSELEEAVMAPATRKTIRKSTRQP